MNSVYHTVMIRSEIYSLHYHHYQYKCQKLDTQQQILTQSSKSSHIFPPPPQFSPEQTNGTVYWFPDVPNTVSTSLYN